MVDGLRRRGGLAVGDSGSLEGVSKTPVRNLLPYVYRLNNVAPMPHDCYLLSPSDPPQPAVPQKQGSLSQDNLHRR